MENFKALIANELAKGRNVIFVPNYDHDFTNDFLSYLWKNYHVVYHASGEYVHIDTPLLTEERIK